MELLHQNIDNGELERGREVFLVMLDEVGLGLEPIAQVVEKRGFQPRKAVVEARDVRLGKLIGVGIALTGEPVDNRTAGIAQAHHLRTLVDGLAGGIVDGLAENLHIVVGIHLHNLRISTAHEQAEEGKRRRPHPSPPRRGREQRFGATISVSPPFGGVGGGYKMRHHVPLQVVHVDERDAQRACKAFRKAHAHEQRAHQPGTAREGDGRELLFRDSSLLDGLIDHGHDVLLVRPRCQLRHHAAVSLMYGLRRRDVRQQFVVSQHRRRRVVAARLYT